MIVKYKDKEYNIELNTNSLIELKNKCYNNEFYFLFKYLITIDEFSKWFYSEYSSYKEFMQYPNKCRICGKHSKIEFCKEHQKTKEFYEYSSKKAKQTMLEKYGSENYNVLQTKKAIKEKYGVDNISQVKEINDKIRKTKALQNHKEINEKRKNTCLKKYGIDSVTKIESTKLKTKNTNLERYGKEYYTQTDEYKLSNKQTWSSKTTEELEGIKKKRENTLFERYGLIDTNYRHFKNFKNFNESTFKSFISNNKFDIRKCSEYFNISYTTVNKYKELFNIRESNISFNCKTQLKIFDLIQTDNKLLDYKLKSNKEIDIYLPSIKLGIEYNGLLYHSQGYSKYSRFNNINLDRNYHLSKTLECFKNNIQLFHIFEFENLDIWLSMINNKLGLNEKIFARKCVIKEVDLNSSKLFLKENHIQGYTHSKIRLGLYLDDKLVSLMTFGNSRFNKKYEYELIRFCNLCNYNVIGGASKLLKYFIKNYKPKSIISYGNLRFCSLNNNVYEKLGFSLVGKSNPNYFYFDNTFILQSRNKYQKHKLSKLLSEFDENLSEAENMFKNGYRRIYDCGNLIYELIL